MSATGLQTFDKTIHETNVWLKDMMDELGIEDRHQAYRILKGVLHVVRDRLTVTETQQLAAQLPMLVRGFYYEGWRPSDSPTRPRHKEEFLERVEKELEDLQNRGAQLNIEAVTAAGLKVIEKHVTWGEVQHVIQQMPKALKDMWPQIH